MHRHSSIRTREFALRPCFTTTTEIRKHTKQCNGCANRRSLLSPHQHRLAVVLSWRLCGVEGLSRCGGAGVGSCTWRLQRGFGGNFYRKPDDAIDARRRRPRHYGTPLTQLNCNDARAPHTCATDRPGKWVTCNCRYWVATQGRNLLKCSKSPHRA